MGDFLHNLWDQGGRNLTLLHACSPTTASPQQGGAFSPCLMLSDTALWDILNAHPSVLPQELQWLQKLPGATSSSSLVLFLELSFFVCLFLGKAELRCSPSEELLCSEKSPLCQPWYSLSAKQALCLFSHLCWSLQAVMFTLNPAMPRSELAGTRRREERGKWRSFHWTPLSSSILRIHKAAAWFWMGTKVFFANWA